MTVQLTIADKRILIASIFVSPTITSTPNGICSELNHALQKLHACPEMNLFIELDIHVFPYFSKFVVQAFKEAFYPSKYAQDAA